MSLLFRLGIGSLLAALSAMAIADDGVFQTRKQLPQGRPVAGLNDAAQDRFMLGRSFFTIPWVAAPSATSARDGLGPLFNANSCVACHSERRHRQAITADGRLGRGAVVKLAQPHHHAQRPPGSIAVADPRYGAQIAINGIGGVPFEALPRVHWQYRSQTLADGRRQQLRYPLIRLNQRQYGPLHRDTRLSLRLAPVLTGLGLLAQVPEADILAHADPDDANGDGITGRAHWVPDPASGTLVLGRFGYKAAHGSVISQTADAAAHDMGLSSPWYPQELCTTVQQACLAAPRSRHSPQGRLDLPLPRLQAMAFYLEQQRAPANTDASVHPRGRRLFAQLGCAQCHRPQLRTAAGLVFEPYTDLLLHDMGAGLADGRPEFDAGVQHWRTAPLWLLGAKQRAGIPLLHDGRARNAAEAILWHGGEAGRARRAYVALSATDRAALHLFLESL